jgi:hypothetical protein
MLGLRPPERRPIICQDPKSMLGTGDLQKKQQETEGASTSIYEAPEKAVFDLHLNNRPIRPEALGDS